MAHCTLSHAWAVSVTNHTIMCESSPQTASVILYLSQTQGQNASNAGVSPSTTAPPPPVCVQQQCCTLPHLGVAGLIAEKTLVLESTWLPSIKSH